MRYEPNDKHKKPWQPGRKGSLCSAVGHDITEEERSDLLNKSDPDPLGSDKRYATDGRHAFCAQSHGPDVFHGYPVGWKEVPEQLRNAWIAAGRLRRNSIRRYWDDVREPE